jgi:hypothetical protein
MKMIDHPLQCVRSRYTPLLLALLADWFFYQHPLGWLLGVYGLMLACILFARARPRHQRSAYPILLLISIPAFASIWRIDWVTTLVLVVLIWAMSIAAGGGAPPHLSGWPMAFLRFPLRFLTYFERRCANTGRVRAQSGKKLPFHKFVRNWVLPMGLTLVFVVLFSVANPVFSDWIRRLMGAFEDQFYQWLSPLRWLFWGIISLLCWCLMRYRAKRAGIAQVGKLKRIDVEPIMPLGRTLGLFNLVFAIQNMIDARYLVYGAELPNGMTYAQYAHRGAYPLVATALLAGAFILIVFPPGRDKADSRLVRGLLYAWILQNVLLTIAAVWRLWLYVGAYGLTRLRVAAALWMLLVATGLLFTGARLCFRYTTEWLLRANAIALACVLACWMFADIHGFVARFNVSHCRERNGAGVSIDLQYLQQLGPAALPALRVLAETEDLPENMVDRVSHVQTVLAHQLNAKLTDWRGWTVQRLRLLEWTKQ